MPKNKPIKQTLGKGGRTVKPIGKTNMPMPGEGKRSGREMKPEAKRGIREGSQSSKGKGYKLGR